MKNKRLSVILQIVLYVFLLLLTTGAVVQVKLVNAVKAEGPATTVKKIGKEKARVLLEQLERKEVKK